MSKVGNPSQLSMPKDFLKSETEHFMPTDMILTTSMLKNFKNLISAAVVTLKEHMKQIVRKKIVIVIFVVRVLLLPYAASGLWH